MMKKIVAAAAIAVALLAPARADYIIKDGNGVVKTFKAGTVSGNILPYSAPTDATGIPYSAANPLSITFGSLVQLPSFATPQHFICDSGCGGGGGGGGLSVPFATPIGANGTPVGFKDASGNLQPLLGDTTFGQWVNLKASVAIGVTGTFWQATQPVSLTTLPAYAVTPTFNLGALNGAATAINQLSTQGPVGAGTAAGNSDLVGGVYNSSPITMSNGQQAALQLDAAGSLRVNVVTSVAGGGGGTSSTFGATFPSTGTAIGMLQSGVMAALTGTSGNLNVQCSNCSGSGVSTADGATFTAGSSLFAGAGGIFQTTPTNNPVADGKQGLFQMTAQRALFTNLRNASGTEIGTASTPIQVSLANTAANGTALLVNGAGGTFPVSQAVAANLNATVVNAGTFAVQATIATPAAWGINALGSTTSGQSGQLALGAVTTSAPSYTTAQSNALSLTTSGALRVDGSGVTQPVSLASTTITGTVTISGAVTASQTGNWTSRVVGNAGGIVDFAGQNASSPANAFLMGAQFNTSPTTVTSGNTSPLQIDNAGNLKVNIVTGASSGAVAQGSTTSGQTGNLMQGAVTTAAPTYTTAQTNPLSLTTSGALRTANADIGTTVDAPCTLPASTTACSLIAIQKAAVNNIVSPIPLNVNTVATAQTGLTPGSTSSSQSGTIIAANVDLSSQAGVALAVPTAYGTAPSGRAVSANAFVTNFGTGTAGTPGGGVVTVQGVASMTKLLVTPDSVALPANQSVNVNQISGSAISASNPMPISHAAAASGGATPSFVVAANSNNSTSLKGSAGTVYGIQASNINASTAYFIKLYDKATAPTCGTDTPVAAYVIPPSNGGNNVVLVVGKAFTLGIGYCIVTGIANNDNTSVPAATILANIDWK